MKWLIVFAIFVGIALRINAIESSVAVVHRAENSSLVSLDRSEWVFEPDVEVIIYAGADGQPGRAGKDDDFNGIVDDASELGAFRSDDVCLTPADADYDSIRRGEVPWRVISLGAWVKR